MKHLLPLNWGIVNQTFSDIRSYEVDSGTQLQAWCLLLGNFFTWPLHLNAGFLTGIHWCIDTFKVIKCCYESVWPYILHTVMYSLGSLGLLHHTSFSPALLQKGQSLCGCFEWIRVTSRMVAASLSFVLGSMPLGNKPWTFALREEVVNRFYPPHKRHRWNRLIGNTMVEHLLD